MQDWQRNLNKVGTRESISRGNANQSKENMKGKGKEW